MVIGITGGTGFIGQALTERLASLQFTYKIFDSDLDDFDAVLKFVSGCDQVIHLAGVFSNDFDVLMTVNVRGTRNVVDASKMAGVERIIFSSTGAVYGEPLNDNMSVEEDPLFPNTLYGLSKQYAEEYLSFSQMKFLALRFPNVYGIGNKKGVIYNFIHDIQERGEVTIFGDGKQQRNFLYVEDAVDAILLAIEHTEIVGVMNIADRNLYSLNDVLDILKTRCRLHFQVKYMPAEVSNQLRVLSLSINSAEQVIGWKPKMSLADGLKKTLVGYEY